MANKEEAFEVEGVVTQALANTRFRVELDTGSEVLAHVAGRMPRACMASKRGATNSDSFRRADSTRHATGKPVRTHAPRCRRYP